VSTIAKKQRRYEVHRLHACEYSVFDRLRWRPVAAASDATMANVIRADLERQWKAKKESSRSGSL
jgi:hypothetical protein